MQGSSTFTVESGVLGEGLTNQHRDLLLGKQPHRGSIPVQITGSKSLVSRVKEGIVLLPQEDLEQLVPLLLRGVDPGRVVGASVYKEDGSLWGVFEIGNVSFKVQSNCLLVVVSVVRDLVASRGDDGMVIGP